MFSALFSISFLFTVSAHFDFDFSPPLPIDIAPLIIADATLPGQLITDFDAAISFSFYAIAAILPRHALLLLPPLARHAIISFAAADIYASFAATLCRHFARARHFAIFAAFRFIFR
jgi:hypothetical protein